MALKVLDFETGPEGAALTGNAQGGNSGATQVNAASGGSAVFAKDVVRSGLLGARFTSGTNALAIARFASTAANNTLSVGIVFQHKQTPTLLTGILSLRHASGVAGRINWNPDNSLSIVDSTLGNTLAIATGLTPGTNYELTIRAKSATTTTGTVTAVLYSNSGTELGRATSSTYNLTANTLAAVDVGIINTNSATGTIVALDYLQLDDGNANELRAPSSTVAYSGTATATATASAAGGGAPAASGSATTASSVSATGAGTASIAGATATASSIAATGLGVPATAGAASVAASVPTAANGAPGVAGLGSGVASVAIIGTGAGPLGGVAATEATLTTAAVGLAATRGVAATGLVASSVAAGAPSFFGVAETLATVVATGGASAVPHDVDAAAWLLPRRYGVALRPRRYDAMTLPNRWKGDLR